MPTLKARKRRVRRRSAKKRVKRTKGKKKRSRRRTVGGMLGGWGNSNLKNKWKYCIKEKVKGPDTQNYDCAGMWSSSAKLKPPSMLAPAAKQKYEAAAVKECKAYAPKKSTWDSEKNQDVITKRDSALRANGTDRMRKCIAAKGFDEGVPIFNNLPAEAMFYMKTDPETKKLVDLNEDEKRAKKVEFFKNLHAADGFPGLLSGKAPTEEEYNAMFLAATDGGRRKSRRRRRRRRKKSKQSKKRRRRRR